MARTVRGSTGFVSGGAGAAISLSVAALAQNASVDARAYDGTVPANPVMIEPEPRQARHQVVPTSQCSSSLGQFLKELTSPPNPFGSACDLRDDW